MGEGALMEGGPRRWPRFIAVRDDSRPDGRRSRRVEHHARLTPMAGIALVLGAGGTVGHAVHAGVLAALGDVCGWDARRADVVVGTSAGSVVAVLLRAGMPPADLIQRGSRLP